MTPAESLDNRLATIAFLVDTAVVPDDGFRWEGANSSFEVLLVWAAAYLYGPVWNRVNV